MDSQRLSHRRQRRCRRRTQIISLAPAHASSPPPSTGQSAAVRSSARARSRVFVPLCSHVGRAWHVRRRVFVRVCARLRVWVPARACLPARISAGKGLTPPTSAPGLGSPLPHQRRDFAHRRVRCLGLDRWLPPQQAGTREGAVVRRRAGICLFACFLPSFASFLPSFAPFLPSFKFAPFVPSFAFSPPVMPSVTGHVRLWLPFVRFPAGENCE
jgi:hypothetical protein